MLPDICRSTLLDVISNSTKIKEQLSFKEHLKLYHAVSNLPDEKIVELYSQVTEQRIKMKPPKTNPKLQKAVDMGVFAASFQMPFMAGKVVSYLTDLNIYKCAIRCTKRKDVDKELCYKQCKFMGTRWGVRYLEKEIRKCNRAENPYKCKRLLFRLLSEWRQKLVKQEIKFRHHVKVVRARMKARK